ncbi:hypothetical protein JEV24_13745 [Pseudomonas aeruginosa]|uniref:hypothetical protein n=1 Tax=Pseudomonas aeruginosa TaxID=287 RepID=UPI000F84A847|nr:hypothetical protein [Pseudomonas aeruginosa]MBI7340698.1 hypothetical protein [Pseudomonas aeruginosa]RTV60145.1 hypothetical protein DY989_11560 [Pseudomonas aeruginosa]
MKITEIFKLGKSQFEIDFVDIDPDLDTRLFVDPYLLGFRIDRWSVEAASLVRSYFSHFLKLIAEGKNDAAFELFSHLHEPNETCLGLSSGKPRGNGVGSEDAKRLFDSIIQSKAIRSGNVADLEDFRLFIPGIGKDKISDVTTNIIRGKLLEYTQEQCKLHGIPLSQGIAVGPIWDPIRLNWISDHCDSLVINGKKILLTPKSIVSFCKIYTPEVYYNKHVLEYLQHEHIRMGSIWVEHRKDGSPFVSKKTLKESVVDYSKEWLFDFTEKHPEVFKSFKETQALAVKPLDNESIDPDLDIGKVIDHLIVHLQSITPGSNDASSYHRAIVGIIEILLYPNVCNPVLEQEINQGRKRIDIYYSNAAREGFFYSLHMIHKIPCAYVIAECKNYSKDIRNPELDQMIGRLTVNRGKLGIIACRNIDNKKLFLERCRDSFRDDHGLILPLTDEDFIESLKELKKGNARHLETLLSNLKDAIIMS